MGELLGPWNRLGRRIELMLVPNLLALELADAVIVVVVEVAMELSKVRLVVVLQTWFRMRRHGRVRHSIRMGLL